MKTLLLDLTNWDLVVDASGDLAFASDPYALAQDVASACRTFRGEYWYDTTIGVPYFPQILGQFPSLAFVKNQLALQALTVPGVQNPVVFLQALKDRVLQGQVQFKSVSGTQVAALQTPTKPPSHFTLGVSSLGGSDVI